MFFAHLMPAHRVARQIDAHIALYRECLDHIEEVNPAVNAVTAMAVKRARREAKEAERLERNTMEREIQALRKDRDRLEQELAARASAEPAQPQITPEMTKQVSL